MISRATASGSRCPCISDDSRARLVFSQSCSRFALVVSRRLATIRLMLSLSSATSPLASTVIDWVRSPSATALATPAIADLGGEVAPTAVDGFGQPLPRARHALDLGLAAEAPFGADLAGDARHLVGEGGQLVDHRVDRGLQLEDLAERGHLDLLGQVALGHRGGDLGDV